MELVALLRVALGAVEQVLEADGVGRLDQAEAALAAHELGHRHLGRPAVELQRRLPLRHAAGVELRQLISDAWSFGAAYRFYTDSWGVLSHTARAELVFLADADTILAARYRFYIQGPADFYQAHYPEPAPYVTSDKELSPLSSHRAALEFDRTWRFDADRKLSTVVSLAALFYQYTDFPPLSSMNAFEFNVAMVFVP